MAEHAEREKQGWIDEGVQRGLEAAAAYLEGEAETSRSGLPDQEQAERNTVLFDHAAAIRKLDRGDG